ncbi:MAG: AAA family ATPase [Candidatus Aureabacteria bacterium]|nr:AAA family ATPase [Candidatus Auribacterota bacterium]
MKKNIFLTGPPSCGKTTVIKKILEKCPFSCKGFFTEEIREEGRRQGFLMKSLDGKKALLGHRTIVSPFQVSKYGVSIENIEALAVPSITPDRDGQVIILDEIGKMECFSQEFQKAAIRVLDSSHPVIGTIAVGGTEFIRKIKERDDIDIIEVTRENRNHLTEKILEKVGYALESRH